MEKQPAEPAGTCGGIGWAGFHSVKVTVQVPITTLEELYMLPVPKVMLNGKQVVEVAVMAPNLVKYAKVDELQSHT